MSDELPPYTFKTSARARRARITVKLGGEVEVTVPKRASINEVRQWVNGKSDWIKAKVKLMKDRKPVLGAGGSRREFYQYRARARRFVADKIRKINQIYGFKFNRISIRWQKTRWGSCSARGNLNFNYKIIFLPDELANYLVTHEICHLKEMNHSARFWNLVARNAPDYKILRRQLRKVA